MGMKIVPGSISSDENITLVGSSLVEGVCQTLCLAQPYSQAGVAARAHAHGHGVEFHLVFARVVEA